MLVAIPKSKAKIPLHSLEFSPRRKKSLSAEMNSLVQNRLGARDRKNQLCALMGVVGVPESLRHPSESSGYLKLQC